MDSLVGRIVGAITSDPDLMRDIGNQVIDINANPTQDIADLIDGAESATHALLSGTASAIAAAAIEQSGLRERLQQGTINLYNNTRARITQGANSLRQSWQNRRNRPERANVAYMVGGKKSKRRSKKSKRKRRKSKTHRRSR